MPWFYPENLGISDRFQDRFKATVTGDIEDVNGLGVARDNQEAVRLFRIGAERGDPEAQAQLARIYMQGRDLPADESEASKWWLKAAEQGHTTAQAILGWMYMEGRGVPRNSEEAEKWLRRAAESGNELAQEMLSDL